MIDEKSQFMRICVDRRWFKFKILKSFFLMQAQLTEFLLRLTFQRNERSKNRSVPTAASEQQIPCNSQQLLGLIYSTINQERNYKNTRDHRLSLSSEDTTPQSPIKCNCKKSKCLKLYCECFSKGSFCRDCNCECCQNTEEFSDIRARAIDEMMVKTLMPFGSKSSSSIKGCNCKKTGCQKKYCECFNQGVPCNEFCKCSNCSNCAS